MRSHPWVWFIAVSLGWTVTSGAQDSAWVRSHYAKAEYRVPMRDGVRLFTSVYAPRDTTRRFPILLTRTPYSVAPYGPEALRRGLGPSPEFAADGFIFVYQDVRGRYMSEGDFVHMPPQRDAQGPGAVDESTDIVSQRQRAFMPASPPIESPRIPWPGRRPRSSLA